MADLFFGKFTYPEQVLSKTYIVTDGTVSWFNGISVGDIAFILHKGYVIGLWKLSDYKKEGKVIKALFEEIYGIEGLKTTDFIALTCFKLNIDLLNKSSRPSPGIGFFRIELEDRTIDEMKDRETFENIRNCRRKIYCCQCRSDAEDKARENPNDIIIYKEAGKIELFPSDFIDAALQEKFNNYKDFYEKSCRYDEVVDVCNKDPDALFNRSIKFIEEAFRNSKQVSEDMLLTTFYDIFFGETDYRLNRLGPPPKYYIMRHKHESQEESSKIFEFAREHRFGLMQFDYREEQRSKDGSFRSVRTNLNKASNVKEGDVLFFQAYDGMIYAYGKVIPPRENADMTVEYPNEEINAINSSGKVIHFKDKMLYLDYKNYPFSSTDWPWGQRIDVDEWKNNGPYRCVKPNSGYDRSCFEEIDKNEAFRLMKLLGDDNMFEDECRSTLEKVKNIVFTGAPGTGKTYFALKLAEEFAGDVSRVARVQFHPSYDYTDFVEGLRPIRGSAEISFERKDGIFKTICKKAKDDPENRYVLVIDEINRGDISKIFGELFSLIESDYRDEKNAVFTQYSNLIDESNPVEGEWEFQKFWVPENVFIIGTMNDIDRSVESMDFAIRRRFSWIEMKASEHLGMLGCLSDSEIRTKCISKMKAINEKISTTPGLGEAFEIGGSYFRHIEEEKGTENEKFDALWRHYIGPIIKEYLRGFNSSTLFNEIKNVYDEA